MDTLADWIRNQPHGAIASLSTRSRIGRVTIWRAVNGHPVTYPVAKALSEATGGAVAIAALCEGGRHRRPRAARTTRRKAA